uniref:Alkanesulfonate monooxygenase n=1 Tax=Lygus hesperus TaxID=30085 RepID=A0A0A9Y8P6_LYGHE
MLLVQLTSDMHDAVDLKHEMEVNAAKQLSNKVGSLRGGEVISVVGPGAVRGQRHRSVNADANLNSGRGGGELQRLSNNLLNPEDLSPQPQAKSSTNPSGSTATTRVTPKELSIEPL